MNITQGEWKATYVSGGDYEITSDGFVGWIAKVNVDCYSVKSNAHLIAAAPTMLQALKAARISMLDDEDYQKFKPVIATIDNALAKAEGK
jgi:hypothetical protein